jgi:hypothetical protein
MMPPWKWKRRVAVNPAQNPVYPGIMTMPPVKETFSKGLFF